MKTITILSGKGGAGKSTLTASLAVMLAERNKIVAVDCDADAPNLALVLGLQEKEFKSRESLKTGEKAYISWKKCQSLKFCPKCQAAKHCLDSCNYSAITWNPAEGRPEINELLCTGCGACLLSCPTKAIELEEVENAMISVGNTHYGFPIVSGQLKVGESGSGKVVNALRTKASKIAHEINAKYMILDAAAGIGCPVIASVRGSDYALLVTEPTPMAFSDLKKAIELINHFNIPCGAVINKWGVNKDFSYQLQDYFQNHQIPLLGMIPYDIRFVEALVNLKPAVVYEPNFKNVFTKIMKNCRSEMEKI